MNQFLYLLYRPLNYSSIPRVEYNLNFLNTSDQVLSISQQRFDVLNVNNKNVYCIQGSPHLCKEASDYDNFLFSTLDTVHRTPSESLFTLILSVQPNVTMTLDSIITIQEPIETLIDSGKYLIKLNQSDVGFVKQTCATRIPSNITYSIDAESAADAMQCSLSYQSNTIPNTTDQIWFWDSGEPESGPACVVAQGNGKFKSFACGEPSYFACQSISDPLKWQISQKLASFQNIVWDNAITCPDNYQFGVPRLPIIYQQLQKQIKSRNLDSVLINLSDAFVSLCFMENAAECPYTLSNKQAQLVTVSIAGGLVILVLTFLCVYLNYKRYSKYMKSERRRGDIMERLRLIQLNTIPK